MIIIPKHLQALIKENVKQIYLTGRDGSHKEVLKWANFLDQMAWVTNGFPVLGKYEDPAGRPLVVLDIRSINLREDGHLINELTLEYDLVLLTQTYTPPKRR